MKTAAKLTLCFAIFASLLTGCQTVPPITTPSGKPECHIETATVQQVQDELLTRLVPDGWMLKQQTDSQLVMWKENDNTMANALLGSSYDPTTTWEIRFVFAGTKGGVQVYGQAALLTNEGSAFEQRSDMTTAKAGWEIWQILQQVEQKLEGPAGSAQEPEGAAQVSGG